jgi:hypothetical protein
LNLSSTSSTTLTYNGTAQTVTYNVSGAYSADTGYSVSGNSATNAAGYTATLSKTSNNYTLGTSTFNWVINKAPITLYSNGATSFVYTGSTINVGTTVNGSYNTGYTLTGTSATAVGNYSASISSGGTNYSIGNPSTFNWNIYASGPPYTISGLTYNTGSTTTPQFPTVSGYNVIYITGGSGTLSVTRQMTIYDIFLVGGGAGGYGNGTNDGSYHSIYPGKGGNVIDLNSVNTLNGNTLTMTIGTGGNVSTNGNNTTISSSVSYYNATASGGDSLNYFSIPAPVTSVQNGYNLLYYAGTGGGGSDGGGTSIGGAQLGGGGGGAGYGANQYGGGGNNASPGGDGGGISSTLPGGTGGASSRTTVGSPGSNSPYGGGGGGGGAGGSNPTSAVGSNGGAGGNGTSTSGTGGGGAGGPGDGRSSGTGGGGGGGDGGVNTGGGGGGASLSANYYISTAGKGGSGIIVIIYNT